VGDPLQVIGVRDGANVEAQEVTLRSEEEKSSGKLM
jgi:hypothetical protein